MDNLTLARWQFGITTVYHFIFVPLTIGMSLLVATMQTLWYRSGNARWLKLTKFFGKLLLINFAIGIATGIVQEFQFGMNWSEYSRFVGDIFGAPLAMEALIAFFIESTFLGVWIFGWDKLPKKIHLTSAWLFAVASNLSAFFILAANSWMQHPVGAVFDKATGRAEMKSLWAVCTNPTVLAAFPHTFGAGLLTASTMVAAICAWWMVKLVRAGNAEKARDVYRPGLVLAAWVIIGAGLLVIVSGDAQGKLMFQQQPMKMAAAEALIGDAPDGASMTLFAVGNFNNDPDSVHRFLEVPGVTSFLAKNDFSAPLKGVTTLQKEYEEKYGAGVDYVPNLAVTFWSFRLMIAFAAFSALLALMALWITRGGKVTGSKALSVVAQWAMPTIFLASATGWIFTEMGRQPWIVAPNPTAAADGVDQVWMLTQRGLSTAVPAWQVLISMTLFTLVYLALAVCWFRLMHRYTIGGVADDPIDPSPDNPANQTQDADRPLSFAY